MANLKQELEEAKERKKVSSSERDEIRKGKGEDNLKVMVHGAKGEEGGGGGGGG